MDVRLDQVWIEIDQQGRVSYRGETREACDNPWCEKDHRIDDLGQWRHP